jgi:hypothetical protein
MSPRGCRRLSPTMPEAGPKTVERFGRLAETFDEVHGESG